MVRRDPTSQAGWVRWPANGDGKGFRDGGEGGMSAFACWSGEGNLASVCADGISIHMKLNEVFIGASGPDENGYTQAGWEGDSGGWGPDAGYYADAVLLLGSTGGSWFNEDTGKHFQATWYDLAEEGKRVLYTLSKLYGCEPDILTFLDT